MITDAQRWVQSSLLSGGAWSPEEPPVTPESPLLPHSAVPLCAGLREELHEDSGEAPVLSPQLTPGHSPFRKGPCYSLVSIGQEAAVGITTELDNIKTWNLVTRMLIDCQ